MTKQIIIHDIAELDRAAEEFLPLLERHKVFAFYGGMGAGKTTFINALCQKLGVSDNTGSPTFAIVNEYRSQFCGSVFHFDFYRINSIEEVYDIGHEDYFYSNQPCLIEWPELIEPLLPDDTVEVRITVSADRSRVLQIRTQEQ